MKHREEKMKFLTSNFEVYKIFNMKQPPNNINDLLSENNKLITFLNPYSIFLANKDIGIYKEFDFICSDGVLPVLLNRFLKRKRIERISFDFTSLAPQVFDYAINNNKSIYFIGTDKFSICKFVNKIKGLYPELNVAGWNDGYFNKEKFEDIAKFIITNNVDIVIIGMGTPLQDSTAVLLKKMGFKGTIYTCGGFFHQLANSSDNRYFPEHMDKLHLRWLHRVIYEPHTRTRILKTYPKFLFTYVLYLIFKGKNLT